MEVGLGALSIPIPRSPNSSESSPFWTKRLRPSPLCLAKRIIRLIQGFARLVACEQGLTRREVKGLQSTAKELTTSANEAHMIENMPLHEGGNKS